MTDSQTHLSLVPREADQQQEEGRQSRLRFLVVGVGASAGGIPALQKMLAKLPADTGMAFVVVLHIPPDQHSEADAILQRETGLRVIQVSGPLPIEPDCVYVIPPGKDLVMEDDQLLLLDAERPRGHQVAIDMFFRTLAHAHRERAVAVVLSGSGSDGAAGIARIKEEGGVAIAQYPGDAEFDSMPLAAIATGAVDFILPAEEIGAKLLELRGNADAIRLPPLEESDPALALPVRQDGSREAEEALQNLLVQLRAKTGHDFRCYKRATVLRRIERRLQVRGVADLPSYCQFLEKNPDEYAALLKDMLIGVTNFFRDREVFNTLEQDVLPELLAGKRPDEQLRVWVAGCSTGEEAYSLAILLTDLASRMAKPPQVQLFASDIDEGAIAIGRVGLYPGSIVTDVPAAHLRQYFQKEGDRYRIRKTIRDRVLFAAHNLLRDPPFSKLDLISCRNLLIYLNREMQMHLLEVFHFSLNPGGVLVLGSSESADVSSHLFTPIDKKNRIYRAKALSRTARYAPPLQGGPLSRMPDVIGAPRSGKRAFTFAEIHQRVLAQYAPPSVIVNTDSDIVHMSDRAGSFLRHVGGEPTRNLVSLVHPELRLELRTALFQALQTNRSVEARKVHLKRDDRSYFVSMTVRPFHDDESGSDLVLVLFDEFEETMGEPSAPSAERKDAVMVQLEEELQSTKQQLQETVEHSEVSNEELRASNEELQAINEELRSATEELETSKEELQSVNEELVTVNYELKTKVEETGKVNDDLNNLIASTDIATIFVDRGVRIKRYTPRACDIFNMIPGDIGRSLLDITHKLQYPELADDVATTFDTLRPVEREVHSRDQHFYIVRLLPYRTVEDRIEGAVMTFFDITSRRHVEEQLRVEEDRLRLVRDSMEDFAIITMDQERRVTSWSPGAQRMFGYTEAEMVGKLADCLYTDEEQATGVPAQQARRAVKEMRVKDERWQRRKDGSLLWCSGMMATLGEQGTDGFARIVSDHTERMRMEQAREAALHSEHERGESLLQANALKDEFLAVMAHELRQPLNVIHMSVELLSRLPGLQDDALAVRSTQSIREAVAAQAKVIEDLLDVSRVNTGKLAMTPERLDLVQLARRACEAFRRDPATGGREIRDEAGSAPVIVLADKVRLEQVLHNLMGNAVKFTPDNGNITVRVAAEGEQALLEVADNGIGIATEFLPRIFEMFGQAQVHPSRVGGLGIGLSLVRQIVELHGGTIRASSPGPGQGSRFTVYLPLDAQAQAG